MGEEEKFGGLTACQPFSEYQRGCRNSFESRRNTTQRQATDLEVALFHESGIALRTRLLRQVSLFCQQSVQLVTDRMRKVRSIVRERMLSML